MKNCFDRATAIRRMLIVSLFIMMLFTTGLCISCQSQEQELSETTSELPDQSAVDTQPETENTVEVEIEGFAFRPAEIKVAVGSTVIWYNRDSVIHTVTARNKTLDSGSLGSGDTFSYKFDEKGTFEYYCIPHPYMEGTVVVE